MVKRVMLELVAALAIAAMSSLLFWAAIELGTRHWRH